VAEEAVEIREAAMAEVLSESRHLPDAINFLQVEDRKQMKDAGRCAIYAILIVD
jgi:hypothetical protein